MFRKFLLSISFIASMTAVAQTTGETTAVADTLLNAASAQNLTIVSTSRSTSITVRNLDNGPETFFYQTGTQQKVKGSRTQTQINCPDVSSVIVYETEDNVNISFVNPEGETMAYTFDFADPDNRTLKSYIGTRGSDFGFTISRNNTTKWDVVSDGIGFGWINPINNNSDINTSMWRSVEFTWNMILGVKMTHRAQELSFGLGIHWQLLASKAGHYFHKNSDGRITLDPYAEGQTKGTSHLSMFSLQIPVLYGVNFGHKRYCGFKLGPVLNFNTGAHIETKYEQDGSEYTVKTGHLSQRKVTVDAMAMFNYRCIGVYARYAPMKRFNSRTDLDFGTFSTGLMIGF